MSLDVHRMAEASDTVYYVRLTYAECKKEDLER
jgi:hypothetical protein